MAARIPQIYSALNYFGESSFDLFSVISRYLDWHFARIFALFLLRHNPAF